jgi:hypothetical protein
MRRGIAYLVSGLEGWRTRRMTQVYDLSDPARPAVRAQLRPAGAAARFHRRAAAGTARRDLHRARRQPVYFGYGTNKNGIVQIVDRPEAAARREGAHGGEPARAAGRAPRHGAHDRRHTAFPILGLRWPKFAHDREARRDVLLVVNEAIANECAEPRQMAWLVDISVETRPQFISNFTVPEASGGFLQPGGRFGTHSSNESFAPVYYRKLVFLAHFNAACAR